MLPHVMLWVLQCVSSSFLFVSEQWLILVHQIRIFSTYYLLDMLNG